MNTDQNEVTYADVAYAVNEAVKRHNKRSVSKPHDIEAEDAMWRAMGEKTDAELRAEAVRS